jgi:hypothetical protein
MARFDRPCSLWLWALLALSLLPALARGEARAFVDRSEIQLGETVTLNIESDQGGAGEPDLSALGDDVRVVGSSSSTQISLINGQQSRRTLWGVVLEPLSEGVLGIPAIEIRGETTQPLQVRVRAPATEPRPDADLLLEVEVDTESPYVQQQVIYTVRLLYAVTLLDGQLDEPRAAGADMRRLGGDATFSRDIGGRRYSVVERRYALTPLSSGALTIEAPRFRGRALTGPRGGRMFDPGSVVSASGRALELEVRPRPAAASEPWLPAASIEYSLQANASGSLRVGEPLTLTLRLSARGLAAEQLPELGLPALEGAEVYPDQESSQTREGPGGLLGERSRSFAVVPNRPGTLEVPALGIDWWNTADDAAARAATEPLRFEVEGAVRAGVAPAPAQPDGTDSAEPAASDTDRFPGLPAEGGVHAGWRWLALGLLLLWLSTAFGWWRSARGVRRPAPEAATSAPPRAGPELAQALRQGDLAAIAEALRALAAARGLGRDLEACARAMDDPGQAAAVSALQRALYADAPGAEALQQLRHAFANPPRFVERARPGGGSSELPPLYPPR